MIIKSLHISRLFNEYNYDLDLCDSLTFVHSPNGYGKSTLVRILYSALKGDIGYLQKTPFSRFDVCFGDGGCLIVEKDSGKLRLMMRRADLTNEISAEEMAGVRNVCYIPPERLMIVRDGELVPTLATFAEELYERIAYAKEHSELADIPREGRPEYTDADLESKAMDLKAKLDYIREAGFEPELPSGLRFPMSRYELSARRQDYEDLILSVSDYVDRNYQLAESIIIFKDIVNEIFINKSRSITETGRLTINMDNGSSLELRSLSSGERQILIMFYTLLFHAEPGSVVILDEPEISLHVSWQQRLGDFFMDICRVRGLQMIVATHSPTVIHDKWDMARELKSNDA